MRVCLEDTVMGKLHGLTIGLDICSTLHMDVTLDDLGWCIDQVMPANPAYLMALPTRNDPMLSYLTTAFQDHVRVREQFGYKVDDRMWSFFQRLGVIDDGGRPDAPLWRPVVGLPAVPQGQGRHARGSRRSSRKQPSGWRASAAAACSSRTGHGAQPWDLDPATDQQVRRLYEDAKACIHAELPARVRDGAVAGDCGRDAGASIATTTCFIQPSGEVLDEASLARLRGLRDAHAGRYDVQIVVTDGLNAYALTDEGHLAPYLEELRRGLTVGRFNPAPDHVVVTHGRVRAGYRIGETLFGGPETPESADARARHRRAAGEWPPHVFRVRHHASAERLVASRASSITTTPA